MENKKCSRCKKKLPLDNFGLDPRVPSGRQSQCRDCDAKAKLGKYRNMAPEQKRKFLDSLKIVGKAHQERKKARGICRTCTRKALPGLRSCRRHRKMHLETQAFRTARAKREGLCVSCGCRPAVAGKACCVICAQRRQDYSLNIRKEVQAAYGGQCYCCRESGPLFLTIDHVKNNGAEHRRSLRVGPKRGRTAAGYGFYLWLKKQGYPKDDFQLLCMTCNWGKRLNGGICPHVSDPAGHPMPVRS